MADDKTREVIVTLPPNYRLTITDFYVDEEHDDEVRVIVLLEISEFQNDQSILGLFPLVFQNRDKGSRIFQRISEALKT